MDPLNTGMVVQGALTAVAKLATVANAAKVVDAVQSANSYYADTSLPQATKLTRVEPITIVSRDLLNNPETKTVLNSKLALFCAYYLQAVDILTKVQDVEVVRILDKLNPDRDDTSFLLTGGKKSGKVNRSSFGMESFGYASSENYHYRLPTASRMALEQGRDERTIQVATRNMELESKNADLEKKIEALKEKAGNKNTEIGKAQEFGDVKLDELANLSTGKLLNVSIAYNTGSGEVRTITLPISVRLMVTTLPNDSIVRLMTYRSQDISFIERYHDWRAGRIEFLRDLMLAQDLITAHKKASMQDPTNTLAEITRRNVNAKKYGLMTKNPSLVAASTMLVISDAVAREAELKLGGKLENARIREKIFENTYAMIITVVDTQWETVTYYTRGISRGSNFSFHQLETKSRGNGPDVTDILKALTAGQAPSF